MQYFIIIFKTIFFYFFIVFIYKIIGKKEINQLNITELIIFILIAHLIGINLSFPKTNIFISIIPILLLILSQIAIDFLSLNKKSVREILNGKPSVIINKGKINIKEMIKQRYNLNDLLTNLREQNIKTINEVDYAILETNGKLSTFKKDKTREKTFPLPIIIEGKVEYDTLKLLDKDLSWLLDKLNTDISNIFYGFYKDNNIYIIKNKEL